MDLSSIRAVDQEDLELEAVILEDLRRDIEQLCTKMASGGRGLSGGLSLSGGVTPSHSDCGTPDYGALRESIRGLQRRMVRENSLADV